MNTLKHHLILGLQDKFCSSFQGWIHSVYNLMRHIVAAKIGSLNKNSPYFCRNMKSIRSIQIIYVLAIYVAIQLMWWGYRIVQLSSELSDSTNALSRSIWMIVSEGSVFLIILALGVWRLTSAIRKERKLIEKERNFILAVSHELKTPIAATRLSLETLEKRSLTEAQQTKIVSTALKANLRLEGLVEKILQTTQLEQIENTVSLREQNISLKTEKIIARQICNQQLDASIEEGIWLKIMEEEYEILLDNLVQNAIKYVPDQSTITVTLKSSESVITLTVSDEGSGIPDPEKKRVFQKFYRIGDELTRSSKGTGLGLHLCQQIVHRNNGQIRIEDNFPKGAKFIITFSK